MSPKDTAISCNTLVCLLQALEGLITTVELRNETSATGKIESVDSCMNVTMSDAVFSSPRGENSFLANFFIHGRQIRFVRIPDDIDVSKAIESRLKLLARPRDYEGQQRKKLLAARKRKEMKNWTKIADVSESSMTTAPSTTATEPQNVVS